MAPSGRQENNPQLMYKYAAKCFQIIQNKNKQKNIRLMYSFATHEDIDCL